MNDPSVSCRIETALYPHYTSRQSESSVRFYPISGLSFCIKAAFLSKHYAEIELRPERDRSSFKAISINASAVKTSTIGMTKIEGL